MSLLAPVLSRLWRQIEDHGIDPEPVFKEHGIDASKRFDPNARVSYTKVDQIRALAAEYTGDPFFGLKEAGYLLPAHLGSLGFAWLASTSLRSAMERLQRYVKFINEKVYIDLHDETNVLVVTSSSDLPSANAYQRDSAYLALLTRMCRFIRGDDWNPQAITMTHPPLEDTSYYFSYFRCPVEFNAKTSSLHIDLRQADEQLTGSNKQLAQLNDHMVVRYLASLDRDDIINRAKAAILECLGEGGVCETSVAQSLHMSTRNLHRRLHAEDSSFKNLLLEIRTELASQYINDTTLTLTEISFMLGFSEISSFSRAYRRWTGQSPSEARKNQQAGRL